MTGEPSCLGHLLQVWPGQFGLLVRPGEVVEGLLPLVPLQCIVGGRDLIAGCGVDYRQFGFPFDSLILPRRDDRRRQMLGVPSDEWSIRTSPCSSSGTGKPRANKERRFIGQSDVPLSESGAPSGTGHRRPAHRGAHLADRLERPAAGARHGQPSRRDAPAGGRDLQGAARDRERRVVGTALLRDRAAMAGDVGQVPAGRGRPPARRGAVGRRPRQGGGGCDRGRRRRSAG